MKEPKITTGRWSTNAIRDTRATETVLRKDLSSYGLLSATAKTDSGGWYLEAAPSADASSFDRENILRIAGPTLVKFVVEESGVQDPGLLSRIGTCIMMPLRFCGTRIRAIKSA